MQGGEYESSAQAGEPSAATQAALVYARGQCEAHDKQPAIIDAQHDNNEPDTTGKKWGSGLAQIGSALYARNTNRVYIPPSYTYRTTLRFTCENPNL